MKTVVGLPPNIDTIDSVFHCKELPVFYCYGDTIYNPKGKVIPPSIMVHERVHSARQGATPDKWWERYITDMEFRLAEEVPAHQAEYQACLMSPDARKPVKGFRSLSDYQLAFIAGRLSGPLYGRMITLSQAKRLICAQS